MNGDSLNNSRRNAKLLLQEKGQAEGKSKGAAPQQNRNPSQAPQRPNPPASGPFQTSAQSQNAVKAAAAKAPKAGRASSRKGQTSEMFAHLPQYKVGF